MKVGQVGKAELKILAVVIYIAISISTALLTSAYMVRLREDIAKNILCESTGTSPDCELDTSLADIVLGGLAVSNAMLVLLPVLVFMFSCNPKHCKMVFQKVKTAT